MRSKTPKLNLPRLGLDCALIGNLFAFVEQSSVTNLLEQACQQGIYYFDTAPSYGNGLSERRVGNFLRGKESE